MKKSIIRAITIALILTCIIGLIGYQKANEEKSNTIVNPNSWAMAAHFYLDGNGYFHNGKITYELPDGYKYVGVVINVGDTSSGPKKDFEGNVDGNVYMNPFVFDTAYFSWAEWNEEVDGPAPFLELESDN